MGGKLPLVGGSICVMVVGGVMRLIWSWFPIRVAGSFVGGCGRTSSVVRGALTTGFRSDPREEYKMSESWRVMEQFSQIARSRLVDRKSVV